MEKLVITGGKQLHGDVFISGAKNAAVAIIPAAIMAGRNLRYRQSAEYRGRRKSALYTQQDGGTVRSISIMHTLKVDSTGDITTCCGI